MTKWSRDGRLRRRRDLGLAGPQMVPPARRRDRRAAPLRARARPARASPTRARPRPPPRITTSPPTSAAARFAWAPRLATARESSPSRAGCGSRVLRSADMTGTLTLRPYTAADEDAAIELWRRTWAEHYPHIDFTARVPWWRERWRKELVPHAQIVLAERDGALVGFVTVDPADPVSRPDRGGAGSLGRRRGARAARRSQAPARRAESISWSTRTMPAPSASTRSTASPMPATTRTRARACSSTG